PGRPVGWRWASSTSGGSRRRRPGGCRTCSARRSGRGRRKAAGVAETFLRRFFGGKRSAPAADEARAEIDRALADRPDLRGPLGWLRDALGELAPDPDYLRVKWPGPEAARAKLLAGIPLLRDEPPTVDASGFARRWKRLAEGLPNAPAGLAGARRRIHPAVVAAAEAGGEAPK